MCKMYADVCMYLVCIPIYTTGAPALGKPPLRSTPVSNSTQLNSSTLTHDRGAGLTFNQTKHLNTHSLGCRLPAARRQLNLYISRNS